MNQAVIGADREHDDEEKHEDFILSDGTTFRLFEDDAECGIVEETLDDLTQAKRALDGLPESLDKVSEVLADFRHDGWALWRKARDIVEFVEALNGGIPIRGRYADTPEKALDNAMKVFGETISSAVGSIALSAHCRPRTVQRDLDDARDWMKRRDEALGIQRRGQTFAEQELQFAEE